MAEQRLTGREVEAMRTALEPFAKIARDGRYGGLPDNHALRIQSFLEPTGDITVGDLRRARAALSPVAQQALGGGSAQAAEEGAGQ